MKSRSQEQETDLERERGRERVRIERLDLSELSLLSPLPPTALALSLSEQLKQQRGTEYEIVTLPYDTVAFVLNSKWAGDSRANAWDL